VSAAPGPSGGPLGVHEPLLVFVGPTATGKSALAARVAAHLGGEVVSADSVQVYRYFDIGSGKPSAEERALAPHHLIDIADPLEPIEANVWAELARQKISEIRARGAVPIVCGGTFLWVRALIYGLADAPPADATIRARHKEQAEAEGRASLHEALSRVDPKSAARLHPNDLIRVSRALEVFEITGTKLSDIQESHGFRAAHYDARLVSIEWEKDAYEERLRERIREMIAQGFRDEVQSLIARGYEKARAMDAVGYRQVREAVLSDEAVSDEELLQRVTQVTRIFARRQRTWLRDEAQTKLKSSALTDSDALLKWAEDVSAWAKGEDPGK
jgi:tRNA dimethylallyltransferase